MIVRKAISSLLHRAQRLVEGAENGVDDVFLPNVFATNRSRRALLSYITSPFKAPSRKAASGSVRHTNFYEARQWASLLDSFGFQVDVCDFSQRLPLDYNRYDVICGFGESFEQAMTCTPPLQPCKILYSTGCSTSYGNLAFAKLLSDHFRRTGQWLPQSGRLCNYAWPLQNMLSDVIVSLGNEFAAQTYTPVSEHTEVFAVPGFYLPFETSRPRNRQSPEARRNQLLWFGSSGVLHKGLGLVLQSLKEFPELELHVAGAPESEWKAMGDLVAKSDLKNKVTNHGFLTPGTAEFLEVMDRCGAMVFPSVAEGGSPAVITAIAHGGMLPIVTQQIAVDLGDDPIWISSATVEGVSDALRRYMVLSPAAIAKRGAALQDFCLRTLTVENYCRLLHEKIGPRLERIAKGVADDGRS